MNQMKTINLKLYLIGLIILIASICLLLTATYVLYQTHAKSTHAMTASAESIDKQLEVQLVFGIAKGFLSPELFPNFEFWAKSENSSGLCVHFERPDGTVVKRACRGAQITEQWPKEFEKFYLWVFQPNYKDKRPVTHHDKIRGFVVVSPNVKTEISRAWYQIKTLMKLSAITVISLCSLLFFAIDWALRPARSIESGLEKMADGDLSMRLSDFKITEWQRTGQAINHLTDNLQKALFDRNQLSLKLVNAQEQERRYLTRELHDEFGQSLAGLAAVASLMTQTTEKEYPQLVKESKSIEQITAHMMSQLKNLLIQLRPIDFNQLGLIESLHGLVSEWNTRSGDKTHYKIDIIGNFDNLPETIPINIFRITQECLTNISKHSDAENAQIKLEKINKPKDVDMTDYISLMIQDDGKANTIDLPTSSGIGLLGIRERVTALGGDLSFKINKPSGLIIHLRLPIHPPQQTQV